MLTETSHTRTRNCSVVPRSVSIIGREEYCNCEVVLHLHLFRLLDKNIEINESPLGIGHQKTHLDFSMNFICIPFPYNIYISVLYCMFNTTISI